LRCTRCSRWTRRRRPWHWKSCRRADARVSLCRACLAAPHKHLKPDNGVRVGGAWLMVLG
jgi:hypothetical protein